MSTTADTIEAQLLEAQRDALLDYFLGQVVQHSPSMSQHKKTIISVDEAYDYLLLDILVSAKVTASRVSLAINSLQQYINRISLNIESGLFMTSEESENWLEFANRYNYWSADRLLRTYPESYVEPMLRLNKTEFFFQLESSLNQGKITEESVQQAVLGYLNNFEDVSNLEVIAGYEDGVNVTQDKFFFVGRTRTQPYQYYWRSLNLAIRHPDTDALSPNAWGEWKPINLPLSGVSSNTIRPIFLNNRLYITWVEVEERKQEVDAPLCYSTPPLGVTAVKADRTCYFTQIKIAYAKYDGTWSTPSVLREGMLTYRMTEMVAVMDIMQGKNQANLALVAFTRIHGKNPDGSSYDYDEWFEFICDTLLVEVTDLPIGVVQYAGNLVWYYSREHRDEGNSPIPYRTLVLYPATRNEKYPIGGVGENTGAPAFGAGTIELAVEFVHGTNNELQITATSTFEYGSEPDHEDVEGMEFCLWERQQDGTNVLLRSVPLVLDESTPLLYFPNLRMGDRRSVTLVAGFNVIDWGGIGDPPISRYINEYSIGMWVRPLLQLNESNQVQYLSFPQDESGRVPPSIRLNTLFAKELIALASQGIPQVLSWGTQHIRELPLPPSNSMESIDLNGANGIYFWELFFHMPFLVAWRLNIEQRLQEATTWLHFVFNPLEDEQNPDLPKGKPRYWCSRPLLDRPPAVPRILTQPTDPDAIAASEPIHYRKAIFRFYLKNLIDQGDREYRKLTPTAKIVARLIYASADALLGTSPDIMLVANWRPRTLQAVADYENSPTRRMELELANDLSLLPAEYDVSVSAVPSDLFLKPVDTEYLKLWQLLDQRLYNLRHNLTLDGKEFPVGLFDEPISPRDLLKQRYQRVVANRQAGAKRRAIPNYRFTPILSRAKDAVETLIQYGSTLLSLLERKDSVDFERFRMQQQLGLYTFTRNLQQQTIELNQSSLDALAVSRRASQERQQHYQALYEENISNTEQEVIQLQSSAANLVVTAQALSTAGAVTELIPNIFGFAVGGMVFGGILRAIAEGVRCEYESQNAKANSLSVSESYRRRQQDWEVQYKQAEINVEEINEQIAIQNRQLQISITQLAQIEAQQEQDSVLLEYFSNRFTNEGLYMWMISQLSGLYLQAYDAVVSQCLSAEASWQYETGQYDTTFIQNGGWNDLYQGLLVGETLKLALQRMDQEYLKSNVRRLEIVKTVSVKSLVLPSQWEQMKSTGTFTFQLDAETFIRDYPGHYDRRIKTVAVSVPCLLGPYEDIRATLVQTSNSVNLKADASTTSYLLDPSHKAEPRDLVRNLLANQSVVISTGLEDSGMFRLNFDDEQFLPFEGTGVFSNWKLVFSPAQDTLLEALSDIVIHVRYTARDAGSDFASKVTQLLKQHDAQK
ncbi:putative insecticidal toxin [Pseudomonas chlororaphis]|uniref:Putative insecticidal toxin n=1 Tax=Pseudomonas chlororaphis TaxID=587753 RepID=A0A3G7TVU3_9PSED|nr:neuraminidase-like domain-containing protein [Pseudomonas chlororaphis]AZE50396.1 putative insecticidal toxin [Pseudomonas chlororaphis]